MIDEAKFFAWLDGELPADEAAEVERQVAADPDLQRQAAEHRTLAAGLRHAFAPIADAPLPPRLTELLASRAVDKVASLAETRERRGAPIAPLLWKQLSAMAAALAIGIVVGNQLSGKSTSPIHAKAGRLVAGAELEFALQTRLASAPSDEGPRIGLTFRDRAGAICRTFEDHAASGLACREGGDWRIRGLFQGAEGQSFEYRMAAGPDHRLLEQVGANIQGEPLNDTQERAAMNQGWR